MATSSKTSEDHALERLVFFSDAVFAIAITLLVIDLHAPTLPHGVDDSQHWQALWALAPNFLGFTLSFFVIGQFWFGHHNAFSLARHYDDRLLMPNLWLLLFIVLLPFVTAYFSANLGSRVPILIYNANMVIAGLLNLRLGWLATSPPVLKSSESTAAIYLLRERGLAVLMAAAIALLWSLVEPGLSQIALMSMPVWRRLLTWRRLKKQSKNPASGVNAKVKV